MIQIRTSGALSSNMTSVTVKTTSGNKVVNAVYVKKADGTNTKVWPVVSFTTPSENTSVFNMGCGTNPSKSRWNNTTGALQITATSSDTKLVAQGMPGGKRWQSAEAVYLKTATSNDHWFPLCTALHCGQDNLAGLRVTGPNLELWTKHNGTWGMKRTWAAPAIGDKIRLLTEWIAVSGLGTQMITYVYKNGTLIGDDRWDFVIGFSSDWGVPGSYIRNIHSSMLNADLWNNFVFTAHD